MEKEYEFCLRSGRQLKSPATMSKGFGVVCEEKMKNAVNIRLFEPLKKVENNG